jgi:hypothetical protein
VLFLGNQPVPRPPGAAERLADQTQIPANQNSLPKSQQRWLSTLAAGAIAVSSFSLRLAFTNCPTGRHADEPLIANLAMRAAETGRLTANWQDVQRGFFWDRPTYQFSPYTLTVEGIHWVLCNSIGWPRLRDQHILCARVISCFWSALAVFVTFLVTRLAFRSLPAAFLAQAVLALCPLSVEDGMFARVDTFVCFLVVACYYLATVAMRRGGLLVPFQAQSFNAAVPSLPMQRFGASVPSPPASGGEGRLRGAASWSIAAALVAGVAIAAKYNAAPVVIFILWIPLARWLDRRISFGRFTAETIALLSITVAGLVLATPEVFVDPRPLIDGIRFELLHYSHDHIPYQAYGWRDNNLFYWTWYLARLGFGLLPLLAFALFMFKFRSRGRPGSVLASFLSVALVLAMLSRVRFERNLEILLGPMAVAAALGFLILVERLPAFVPGRILVAAILLMFFFVQQARVLVDLHRAIDPQSWPWSKALKLDLQGPSCYCELLSRPRDNPESRGYPQVFLADFNDPFSAAYLPRWRKYLGTDCTVLVFSSDWAMHGYPFSTLDMVLGPTRLYCFRRKVNPEQLKALLNRQKRAQPNAPALRDKFPSPSERGAGGEEELR